MKTWKVVRDQYAALLRNADRTQAEVAERGGLSGQNAISKLLANTHRGPSVETFLRALDGLGISAVEFFALVEQPEAGRLSLTERIGVIERTLTTMRDEDGARDIRRSHESAAAAATERRPTFIAFDAGAAVAEIERKVAALVRATLDPVIERIAAQVEPAGDALRDADSDAAGSLSGGRRQVRGAAEQAR